MFFFFFVLVFGKWEGVFVLGFLFSLFFLL